MILRRHFSTALATTLLALGCLGQAQAQTKWDLPNAYPANNFHTENLLQFAKEVDRVTAGKLKIQVHENASLFKAPEIKRAVQGGQVQAGEFIMVNYQNEWPMWGVDGLPFLASSYDEASRLYQISKPVIEKKLADQGMMLLYAVPWQSQGIFSKKQVHTAHDLKGMKWRAYSPATARIGELTGAQSVTVQQAELAQALATGVIESYMSSSSTGYDTKTFEHLKFFADIQAWLPKNIVVVNKKAFDALDKTSQTGLLKAAADAEKRGWAMSAKKNTEYLDLLKKNGMTVYAPSAALNAELRKVGATMLNEWLEKAGPEGKAVIDAYQKP